MRQPFVIAHRGSSAVMPEHTRAAFERAVEDGADGIECDVRLTADGELVCLHDRTLDRTGGGRGVVGAMTLAQLRAVDWGAWHHRDAHRGPPRSDAGPGTKGRAATPTAAPAAPRAAPTSTGATTVDRLGPASSPGASPPGAATPPAASTRTRHVPVPVPGALVPDSSTRSTRSTRSAGPGRRVPGDDRLLTLVELVELALDAPRPLGLAIETKHPTRSGGRVELAVARVLRDYGLTHPRTPGRPWARVMSFSPLAVRRMGGLLPSLPTVQLVASGPSVLPRSGALLSGARTAGVDIALVRRHPQLVQARHAAGQEVFVWTVDTRADLELCVGLGVDAIITNHPKTALDVLGRSG